MPILFLVCSFYKFIWAHQLWFFIYRKLIWILLSGWKCLIAKKQIHKIRLISLYQDKLPMELVLSTF